MYDNASLKITVFTPSYNRAKFLPRIYQSLCEQNFQGFEWIIVDDGSKDETSSIVEGLAQDSPFPIHYRYKENGGKHTAINLGVTMAVGELFFILDSDDYLCPNSLSKVWNTYLGVRGNDDFAGVAGLLVHSDGKVIGITPSQDNLDCTPVEYWTYYDLSSDKCEVLRTDVFREIPFPEVPNEKFCPEELEWCRISKKYKLRYSKSVLAVRDYLEGGLTANIVKIRMTSPQLAMMDYKEYLSFPETAFRTKIKNAINYWRFRFCLSVKSNVKISWIWSFVAPLGFIMHLRDLAIIKKR